MSAHNKQCPVHGCGVWSHRWTGKKSGYPLPSLDTFALLLAPNVTIDTNTRICTNCYNIHRRPNADLHGRTRITPLPPLNPLLGLLAAATSSPAQPSAAPSSPSFSTSPPPPLPLPPPPPPPLPPPSSAPCPLSDITNAPRRQRRHDTPLKRKRELVIAAAALSTPEQRKQLCVREGVSGRELRRYAVAVKENEQRLRPKQLLQEGLAPAADEPPGKKRRPMTAKRLSGAGRKPALSSEEERWLRDWVLSLRRCEHHFAVAEIHIQLAARAKYGITAGDKWVQGFMQRSGLALRLRTTCKDVTNQAMQEVVFHWRNKFAPVFQSKHPHLLLNLDETSMYVDTPSNRTVDEVGAETIEIGTTHHYKSRLAVLLCIDYQGRLLTPLVVYPCNEKKKQVKTHQFFLKTITLKTGKPFEILVTYARKAWLNGVIMAKWLAEVYHPHLLSTGQPITEFILFMDNCSVHRTDECLSFFTRTGAAYEFFPPHFTPLLQPLDQSYNREFKREFSKEGAEWLQAIGCFGRTPKGNRKAATQDEVSRWVANALSRLTPHIGRVSWARSTHTAHHLLHLPVVLWMRVLSYLPASQTITLSRLMQRHRRYYSGVDYRFPVAAGSRDGEQEERKSEEEAVEEERKEQEWGIVSVDSLYDVTSLPAGVEAGTLRLHPRALLLMR